MIHFPFDNTFAIQMQGFYAAWKGDEAPAPRILRLNRELAERLELDADALNSDEGAAIFAGSKSPEGAIPLAMAYAGHQFSVFSPQLGDGRALLLGELLDRDGNRFDLHLKGSGPTPFSRGGDGKAVLGPVLREYLMGEAMQRLGIPTSRALAAVATGESVWRDASKPGAVLARIAASHLRVGTFQFFAVREDHKKLRKLADYTISRHFPEAKETDNPYLEFLRHACERQAKLVAQWVLVGFVHGVMNTDNMAISGETIDYGPCAFMDQYDPQTVFSSIDRHGRYAYGNQPTIAQWNLTRFAETLLELIDPDEKTAIAKATEIIQAFPVQYQMAWHSGVRQKLGLAKELDDDLQLANDLHTAMQGQEVDFTNLFRALGDVVRGDTEPARKLFNAPEAGFDDWLKQYQARSQQEDLSPEARATAMDAINPLYIPRNHKVEAALQAAETSDMKPFDKLMDVLDQPFTMRADLDEYAKPAPESFGHYTTFCGT